MDDERFFVPLALAPRLSRWRDPSSRHDWFLYVFARLKPGVSAARAEAQLAPPFEALIRQVDLPAQQARLDARAQAAYAARRLVLEPGLRGHNANRGEIQVILGVLLAVTAFVLVIACANVANLLLARATERAGEMAVRRAIGASSARLFRLVFLESLLLAALGGVVALGVARLTMTGLLTQLPAEDAGVLTLALDGSVLVFTGTLSAATALVFGLVPAIQLLRRMPDGTPDPAARTTTARGTTRTRAVLAGSQVALATALLSVAGLLVLSLDNLSRVDLGLQRTGLSMFRIAPVLNGYGPPQSAILFERIERALRELPGVVSVSEATLRLLDDSSSGSNVTVTGYTPGPDTDVHAAYIDVGPQYFATLGIPLLAGREFTAADIIDRPRVAIVNQAFVRKFKLGANAIGVRIGTTEGLPPDTEIVGVVADSTYETAREAPPAQFFRPYRQLPVGTISFYIRTAAGVDPASVMTAVPEVVRRFDANLPVESMRTMDEQFDVSTVSERIMRTLSASFAGLAMLLAAIGLYAVLAYTVSQRVREIGIRMALGARAADVRRMVLLHTSRIAVTASGIGVALAVALARAAASMLYGVTPMDPRVQGGAALLMLAVAFLAALLPARRAAAVDPVHALRAD